jgi:hypothetical protein
MIDNEVCAEFTCALGFVVITGCCDDGALKELRDLNSGDAHA